MESLNLTYKLVDLKIKSKAPDKIYFTYQTFKEPREHEGTEWDTPSPRFMICHSH